MAKTKDPSTKSKNDFEDDFADLGLDSFDDDLMFNDDMEMPDSDKSRDPISKTKDLSKDLKSFGSGMSTGIIAGMSTKIDQGLPSVLEFGDSIITAASELKSVKDDFQTQLRPALNQSKILIRQLMPHVKSVVPDGIYNKIHEKVADAEEEYKAPSKSSVRDEESSSALMSIFQAESEERMADRKQEAVQSLLKERIDASRHTSLASSLGIMTNQSMFLTSFIRSTYTAYMKKDLELKYRHLYVAEDTLEVLKFHSESTTRGLETIRHNTALPDYQKITLGEMVQQEGMNKFVGGIRGAIGGYVGGIGKKIKENFITPALDGVQNANDAAEMLANMMEMQEDSGEGFNARRSLTGLLGSLAGGVLGKMGGKKLLNKIPEDVRNTIASHAKNGKTGLILLLEQLRRGEIEFDQSETLRSILENILPEMDRSGGKFTNQTYTDPTAAGTITKRFTTTVEEIIPGYLSQQLTVLKQILTGDTTGARTQNMVFDHETGLFTTEGKLKSKIMDSLNGDAEQRGALLKGSADAVRDTIANRGDSLNRDFEDVAKDVSVFLLNVAYMKISGDLPLDDLKAVADTGELNSEWKKKAFKGIPDPSAVAGVMVAILTNEDGSTNAAAVGAIRNRIINLITNTSEQARAAIVKNMNLGYRNLMQEDIVGKDGDFHVQNDPQLERYSSMGKDVVAKDRDYGDRDEYGNMMLNEKTGFEKTMNFLGDFWTDFKYEYLPAFMVKADGWAIDVARKLKMEKEYKDTVASFRKNKQKFFDNLAQKKENIRNWKESKKLALAEIVYSQMDGIEELRPITKLIFDKNGKLRDTIPDSELSEALANIPGLHELVQRIHRADNSFYSVLDQMMPVSLIFLAEMTPDEVEILMTTGKSPKTKVGQNLERRDNIDRLSKKRRKQTKRIQDEMGYNRQPVESGMPMAPTLSQGHDPRYALRSYGTTARFSELIEDPKDKLQTPPEKLTEHSKILSSILDENSEIAKVVAGYTGTQKVLVSQRYQNIKERAERLLGNMEMFNPKYVDTAVKEINTAKEGLYNYLKGNDTDGKLPDIPKYTREYKKGGTIDPLSGNPVGTINKATIIAGGNAEAGEAGVETIVPHNNTEAAKDAFASAKAYHEGGAAEIINSKVASIKSMFGPSKTGIFLDQLNVLKKIYEQVCKISGDEGAIGDVSSYDGAYTGDNAKYTTIGQKVVGAGKAIGRAARFVAWDAPTGVAKYSLKNTYRAGMSLIKNTSKSVYRKAAAGQEPGDPELLLISEDQFNQGVFFDREGKEKVESVRDINGPVYDGTGKELISEADIKQGLVDAKGGKIRILGDVVGRGGRHGAFATARGIRGAAKWGWNKAKKHKVVNKALAIAGSPLDLLQKTFQRWIDVYCADDLSKPLVTANALKNGLLTFMDGKEIVDSYCIDRPVVWRDIPENGENRGNAAITAEHVEKGLVNHKGKKLSTFPSKGARLLHAGKDLAGKLLGMMNPSKLISTVLSFAWEKTKDAFTAKNPFIDVYVMENGKRSKDPLIYGESIKAGLYTTADGKILKSAYGITDPVYDNTTTNILIRTDHIEAGLVDSRGKALSKFAGRSLAGKMTIGAAGLLLKGAGSLARGAWKLGTGLAKGALGLGKGMLESATSMFQFGSEIVAGISSSIKKVLESVFPIKPVGREDIKELVTTRLDGLIGLLELQFGKKAKIAMGQKSTVPETSSSEIDKEKEKQDSEKPMTAEEYKDASNELDEEKETKEKRKQGWLERQKEKFKNKKDELIQSAKDKATEKMKGYTDPLKDKAKDKLSSMFGRMKNKYQTAKMDMVSPFPTSMDNFGQSDTGVFSPVEASTRNFRSDFSSREDFNNFMADKNSTFVLGGTPMERVPELLQEIADLNKQRNTEAANDPKEIATEIAKVIKPDKVKGDTDGDGDRDGGYRDFLQKGKARKDARAAKAGGVGGMLQSGPGGITGQPKESKGMLETIGDAKDTLDGAKGIWGAVKGFGGKALGMLGMGGAATAAGGTAAAAGGGIAAAGGGLLASAGAGLMAAAPWVLGAVAVGAAAYGTYKLGSWLYDTLTEDDEETALTRWKETKLKAYGVSPSDDDHASTVEHSDLGRLAIVQKGKITNYNLDNQSFALSIIKLFELEKRTGLDQLKTKDFEAYTEKKETLNKYIRSWIQERFAPAYSMYQEILGAEIAGSLTKRRNPKDLDPEVEPEVHKKYAKQVDEFLGASDEGHSRSELSLTTDGLKKAGLYFKSAEEEAHDKLMSVSDNKSDTASNKEEKPEGDKSSTPKSKANGATGILGTSSSEILGAKDETVEIKTIPDSDLEKFRKEMASVSGVELLKGKDKGKMVSIASIRMKLYGADMSMAAVLRKWEDIYFDILKGTRGSLTHEEITKWAVDCGLIEEDDLMSLTKGDTEEQKSKYFAYFVSWISYRFLPVFNVFKSLMDTFKVSKISAVEKLGKTEYEKFLTTLQVKGNAAISEATKSNDLVPFFKPTSAGYFEYYKETEKRAGRGDDFMAKVQQQNKEAFTKRQIEANAPKIDYRTDSGHYNANEQRGTVYQPVEGSGIAGPPSIEALRNQPDSSATGEMTPGKPGDCTSSGELALPTQSNVVTSPFGPRNVTNGSKNHKGIDLRARMGEPIVAMKKGKVDFAGGSYGTIKVKHDDNLMTRYLHLSRFNVRPGQDVEAGDIVGYAGGKGPNGVSQYTPHLHFDVLKGDTFLDPEKYLKGNGIDLRRKGDPENPTMAPNSDVEAEGKTGKEAPADNPKQKPVESTEVFKEAKEKVAESQQESRDMILDNIKKEEPVPAATSSITAPKETSTPTNANPVVAPPPPLPEVEAPTTRTDTVVTTGKVGRDIKADANLKELKSINTNMSGMRSDFKEFLNALASVSKESSKKKGSNTNTDSSFAADIEKAVLKAFAPDSEAIQIISKAVSGNASMTASSKSNKTRPTPPASSPINVNKMRY